MDGKQLRRNFAYGFLAIYTIYGMFGIGMTGLLFSFAIGLIISSFNQPLEIVVSATILSGLVYKIMSQRYKKEGFQTSSVPTGTGQNAESIIKKIKEIAQPSGVLSSSYAESFADINSSSQPNNAGSTVAKPPGETTPVPSASTPAPTNAPSATKNLEKDLPTSAATTTTSGFSDKATDGMFKLGSIPADAVGGAHIDVGTTLMNALNSLKPDQVKAMTEDTKKLMETQKSLMGMLTTMKPMIQDGKQLMETFTEMFGKQ